MSETFSGTLTGSSGSKLTITAATLQPAVTPVPDGPLPAATNQVTVSGVALPLAAVNPAGGLFPGGRGADQLVAYQAPVVVTRTNMWGVEVTVKDGAVVAVNDRQASKFTAGTVVPAGCVVLSANGTARDALLPLAVKGAPVTFHHVTTPPVVPPVTPPGGPGRTVAVYLMMWAGQVGSVPASCNQVRLAFAQGSPPRLVGSGGQSMDALAAWARSFRATGGKVIVSVGGQDGPVNLSDVAGFVAGINTIGQQVPLDGVDFDVESVELDVAGCVSAAKALATGRPGWLTTFTPSGGPPVARYLQAAVACQRAGLSVQFSQQLYDTPVSQSAALQQTKLAVDALGQRSVLLGFMIGSDAGHWTVQQTVTNFQAIHAAYPAIGGVMAWEASRPGTSDALGGCANLLGLAP